MRVHARLLPLERRAAHAALLSGLRARSPRARAARALPVRVREPHLACPSPHPAARRLAPREPSRPRALAYTALRTPVRALPSHAPAQLRPPRVHERDLLACARAHVFLCIGSSCRDHERGAACEGRGSPASACPKDPSVHPIPTCFGSTGLAPAAPLALGRHLRPGELRHAVVRHAAVRLGWTQSLTGPRARPLSRPRLPRLLWIWRTRGASRPR